MDTIAKIKAAKSGVIRRYLNAQNFSKFIFCVFCNSRITDMVTSNPESRKNVSTATLEATTSGE
jgi:hypothetical protein